MRKSYLMFVCTMVFLTVLLTGCTKSYKIIQDLEAPLPDMAICTIGAIVDELPTDVEEDKKPPLEDIEKFKHYLDEEITEAEILRMSDLGDPSAQYEIRGEILEYKRGSGTMRALFGALAGSAYVTVNLELVDKAANVVAFSGSFKGAVTHYSEAGDAMFLRVAKDFTKVLSKRLKKLRKQ